jgi:hypothetical protein
VNKSDAVGEMAISMKEFLNSSENPEYPNDIPPFTEKFGLIDEPMGIYLQRF